MAERTGKAYRSEALAAAHETATGLHEAGLMDKRTLRRFDELCLTPVRPIGPDEIRALRERERVSQAVLARHLNVTTGLVSQWERGHFGRRPLILLPKCMVDSSSPKNFCSSGKNYRGAR